MVAAAPVVAAAGGGGGGIGGGGDTAMKASAAFVKSAHVGNCIFFCPSDLAHGSIARLYHAKIVDRLVGAAAQNAILP